MTFNIKRLDPTQAILPHHRQELAVFGKMIGVKIDPSSKSVKPVSRATHDLKAPRHLESVSEIPKSRWITMSKGQFHLFDKHSKEVLGRRSEEFRMLLKDAFGCRMSNLEADESPELLWRLAQKGLNRIVSVVSRELAEHSSPADTDNGREAALKRYYAAQRAPKQKPKTINQTSLSFENSTAPQYEEQFNIFGDSERFELKPQAKPASQANGRAKPGVDRSVKLYGFAEDFARTIGVSVKALFRDPEVDYVMDLKVSKAITGPSPVEDLSEANIEGLRNTAMKIFAGTAEQTFESGQNETLAHLCERILRFRLENLKPKDDLSHIVAAMSHYLSQLDVFHPYYGGQTYRRMTKKH